MKFVLDNFNSTKLENVVLAPGDPATLVHPFIAVGLVRKTKLGMTETVTDVEWSEKKITHKYRTNMVSSAPRGRRHHTSMSVCDCAPSSHQVSGPPCCCIFGYGAEMSVEEIGPNHTRLINKSHQDTKWCMPLSPCCCCFCWNAIGNKCLKMDIDALEKKFAAAPEM